MAPLLLSLYQLTMMIVVVVFVVVVAVASDDVVCACTSDTSVCASTFGESWRCTEHSILGWRYCLGNTASILQKQINYSKYAREQYITSTFKN